MSSILDALNKLERDKALADLEDNTDTLDPAQAAQELIGGNAARPAQTNMRLNPTLLIGGGALVMVLMVGVSVVITTLVMRPAQPPEMIVAAVQPTLQSPVTPAQTSPVEAVAVAAPVMEVAPPAVEAPVTTPAPVEVAKVIPPVETVVEVAIPEVTVVAEAPKPKPVVVVTPPAPVIEEPTQVLPPPVQVAQAAPQFVEPVTAPILKPTPEPEYTPPPAPKRLPLLTPAIASRLGLTEFRINMVMPPSATRPYGFAMINRLKVSVGDRIDGSRIRVVDISTDGVSVESTTSGDQYFMEF